MTTILLITSVGSLVGQNVLDSLEGRRQSLRIVATNSAAQASNNFRCDAVHLAPPVADAAAWRAFHARVMDEEGVDLVIPGRDDDVLALAQWLEAEPAMAPRLMVGSVAAARPFQDKVWCAEFAQAQGLAFAPTVVSGSPEAAQQALALWQRHGVLIAKPRAGNGSRGVRLLVSAEQVSAQALKQGLAIQPYLDPHPDWQRLAAELEGGIPLWFEIPERRLHCAQLLIDPQGTVREVFCFSARHSCGKPQELAPLNEPDLLELALAYGRAFAAAGWRGPCNIQGKRDPELGLQVIETNGRFSGGTSARRLLGFDEVALGLRQWLGDGVLSADPLQTVADGRVDKLLGDQLVHGAAIQALSEHGSWRRY